MVLKLRKIYKSPLVIFLSLLLIANMAFTASAANLEESMQALSFTDSKGTVLPYRLYVPDDYDSGKEYPLLLFLHGAGERGSDNTVQIKYNVKILERIVDSADSGHDCIIVAPQCASNHQWVNTPWGNGSYNQDQVPISKYMAATVELLKNIQNEYSVDENRLYVTGLSMGGYGTWDIIIRYPDMFAAALPVCGAGDPSKAELIKDVAIWAFHGDNDDVVPVSGSRDMVAALEECGGNITYSEYEGVNHFSWHNAYAEPDLLSWLFEQSRQEQDVPEPPESTTSLVPTETTGGYPTETTDGYPTETTDGDPTETTDGDPTETAKDSGTPKTGAGSFTTILFILVIASLMTVLCYVVKKRKAE